MRDVRSPQHPLEPPEPEPPPPARTRVWTPILVATGVGLLVVVVVFGAVLLAGVLSPKPEPHWERQAWRVGDQATADYLDGQLRRGWQVERADSDGQGTTYVLRRDPAQPTPKPRPRE